MDKTRVLLADDSLPFRQGLVSLLHSVDEIEIVGEAENGNDAINLAEKLQPDVVLMDLQMPGINGIEATKRILLTSPHIRVLVLSMFEDDASVFSALQAGAYGYLLKGALKSEIVRAIHSVIAGEAIFGPAIAKKIMQYFSKTDHSPQSQSFPELTDREREILILVSQHLTNPEIAQRLSLSQKTVRNHVSNVFSKLQVADRAQAIIKARDAGLGRV